MIGGHDELIGLLIGNCFMRELLHAHGNNSTEQGDFQQGDVNGTGTFNVQDHGHGMMEITDRLTFGNITITNSRRTEPA